MRTGSLQASLRSSSAWMEKRGYGRYVRAVRFMEGRRDFCSCFRDSNHLNLKHRVSAHGSATFHCWINYGQDIFFALTISLVFWIFCKGTAQGTVVWHDELYYLMIFYSMTILHFCTVILFILIFHKCKCSKKYCFITLFKPMSMHFTGLCQYTLTQADHSHVFAKRIKHLHCSNVAGVNTHTGQHTTAEMPHIFSSSLECVPPHSHVDSILSIKQTGFCRLLPSVYVLLRIRAKQREWGTLITDWHGRWREGAGGGVSSVNLEKQAVQFRFERQRTNTETESIRLSQCCVHLHRGCPRMPNTEIL